MILKEKLACLRKGRRLTQAELAEALKVSRQAVSRWEVGATVPSTDNLQRLSELYGISLDDLLNDGREFGQREAEPGSEERARRKKSRLQIFALFLALALGIAIGVLAVYIKDHWGVINIRDIPGETVVLNPDNVFELYW